MDIRHFLTFRTIVDVGSYTNAAKKLGYTQSTITSHIQALEREIGGELFTYIRRELQLTSLGKELIPMADELLDTYHRITQMKNHDKVSGELKIAAPESLTISRLGPILREYTTKYPDVTIIVSNGTCGQNQKDLMSGLVDIAFMVWPKLEIDHCIHHQLHKEEIVLIASPKKSGTLMNIKGLTNTLLRMKMDAVIAPCLRRISCRIKSRHFKRWNCGAWRPSSNV